MKIPDGFGLNKSAELTREGAGYMATPAQAGAGYGSLSRSLEQASGGFMDMATRLQAKQTNELYETQLANAQSKISQAAAEGAAELAMKTEAWTAEDLEGYRAHITSAMEGVEIPADAAAKIEGHISAHVDRLLPEAARHNVVVAKEDSRNGITDAYFKALTTGNKFAVQAQIDAAQLSGNFTAKEIHAFEFEAAKAYVVSDVHDAYAKGGYEAAMAVAKSAADMPGLTGSEQSEIESQGMYRAGRLDADRRQKEAKAEADAKEATQNQMYSVMDRVVNGTLNEDGTRTYLSEAEVEPMLKTGHFDEGQIYQIHNALRIKEAADKAHVDRTAPFKAAYDSGNKLIAVGDPHAKAVAYDVAAEKFPEMATVPIQAWNPDKVIAFDRMFEIDYVPPQVGQMLENGVKSNSLQDTQVAYDMAQHLKERFPNAYAQMPGVTFYASLQGLSQSGMLTTEAVANLRAEQKALASSKDMLDMRWRQEKIKDADFDGTLLANLQKDPHFAGVSLDDAVITPEVQQLYHNLVRQQYNINGANLPAAQDSAATVLRNTARLSQFNGTPELTTAAPETPGTSALPVGVLQAELNDVIKNSAIVSTAPLMPPTMFDRLVSFGQLGAFGTTEMPTPNVDYRVVPAGTVDPKGAPVYAVYYRANNMPVMLDTGDQLHWAPDYQAAQGVERGAQQAKITTAQQRDKYEREYISAKLKADPNWNPIAPFVDTYRKMQQEQFSAGR